MSYSAMLTLPSRTLAMSRAGDARISTGDVAMNYLITLFFDDSEPKRFSLHF